VVKGLRTATMYCREVSCKILFPRTKPIGGSASILASLQPDSSVQTRVSFTNRMPGMRCAAQRPSASPQCSTAARAACAACTAAAASASARVGAELTARASGRTELTARASSSVAVSSDVPVSMMAPVALMPVIPLSPTTRPSSATVQYLSEMTCR